MGEVFVKNSGEWKKIVSVASAPGLPGDRGPPGLNAVRNKVSVIVPGVQGLNAIVQATITPIRTGSKIFVRPFGTLSYGGTSNGERVIILTLSRNQGQEPGQPVFLNGLQSSTGQSSNQWRVGTFGSSGQNPKQTTVLSLEGFDYMNTQIPFTTVAGTPVTYRYNFFVFFGAPPSMYFSFTGLGLTLEEIG